jgi:hypothetical protein
VRSLGFILAGESGHGSDPHRDYFERMSGEAWSSLMVALGVREAEAGRRRRGTHSARGAQQ